MSDCQMCHDAPATNEGFCAACHPRYLMIVEAARRSYAIADKQFYDGAWVFLALMVFLTLVLIVPAFL